MTRPYFTLITRDAKDSPWHIYFGDYDRETVEAERQELRSASFDPIPLNRSRIIRTSAKQADITAAVAKLNSAVEAVSALAEREPAFTVETVTLPECWASALINGDVSGLSDREVDALDSWDRANPTVRIVDVERDAEGNAVEARFTWSFDLYGGSGRGGSVLDYVAHVEREPAAPADSKAGTAELVAAVAAAGISSADERAAELREPAAPAPRDFYRFEPCDAKRPNAGCYLWRGDEIAADILKLAKWRYRASFGDSSREFRHMSEARAFLLGYCEHMDSVERAR
jgi:hypothetical protein